MPTDHEPRALLVNGTVGVGKTSVCRAIGRRLRERGLPGLVVDLDALRMCGRHRRTTRSSWD